MGNGLSKRQSEAFAGGRLESRNRHRHLLCRGSCSLVGIMTDDYPDTIPSEWAASAATEVGCDQDERVEPGMQMIGWLLLAVPFAVALLAVAI